MASFLSRSWLVMLAALGGVGCAASVPAPITSAAQHDLQCEQVQVSEAGSNRYAASGCGRGLVYARSCGDKGCAWTRLPTGAEPPAPPTAGNERVSAAPAPPREIIQAPPPQQREVLPAPAPADAPMRQVIPAPPPANADANVPQGDGMPSSDAAQQQPVPLAQGELSDPYQGQVPAAPAAMRSEYPPPAPLVETRPPAPQPSYVWVSGYWWWNSPAWAWAPGYWCAPMYGYNYVPGGWYWSSGWWWYGTGGWARPGSTLIVQHVHPRPNTWATTRSFRPYHSTTGYGYAPPARAVPKSYGTGYASPNRGYAPARGYAPTYSHAPSYAPAPARTAPVGGYSPGRYVSGNYGASNRQVAGVRGYGAPAPRSFTPQQSPLYRYPAQLNNPMRAPGRVAPSSSSGWGTSRPSAPATGYGYRGSSGSGWGGGARVAPAQPAPVYRSAPIQTAPHDVARGRAFGAPASSFRGSSAPMRSMPSGGGGRIGGGGMRGGGGRVAPRR